MSIWLSQKLACSLATWLAALLAGCLAGWLSVPARLKWLFGNLVLPASLKWLFGWLASPPSLKGLWEWKMACSVAVYFAGWLSGWLDGCASQHNVAALQFGFASRLKVAARMKNGLLTGLLLCWLAVPAILKWLLRNLALSASLKWLLGWLASPLSWKWLREWKMAFSAPDVFLDPWLHGLQL